jgi:hypothetical protein
VETRGQRNSAALVAALHSGVFLVMMSTQRGDVVRRRPAGGQRSDTRFDQRTRFEHLPGLFDRGLGDLRAAIGLDHHYPIVRERLQRRANDRPTCAEQRADLVFGQSRAGRQSMIENCRQQRCVNARRTGAAESARSEFTTRRNIKFAD